MKKENNKIKESIRIKDTLAIWHPEDKRQYKNSIKYSTEKLIEWYGIKSKEWEKIKKNNKNSSIMFIGEAPIKNKNGSNTNLINKKKLEIQCFHSNSSMDKLLKTLFEKNQLLKGSIITDFFHSAYEYKQEPIKISEIKKNYSKKYLKIKKKEEKHFINNIKKGYGSKAIICFGNISFYNICDFFNIKKEKIIQKKFKIKYTEVFYKKKKLKIFGIYHPSGANPYRKEIFVQLEYVKTLI